MEETVALEYLLIAGLVWAIYELWRRVDRLERRLREVEDQPRAYHPPAPLEVPRTRPAEPEAPQTAPEAEPEAEAIAAAAMRQAPEPVAVQDIPASEPEPAGEPETAQPGHSYRRPRFDFEDVFGRKLPIWAGGVALAIAGIFGVMYAIENGMLGPEVRVALSFLGGLVLLAAAEVAFRFEQRVRDPRVRQALAGAGIATLYASFYLAGAQYGLIGPAISFGGLAVVTAIALGLSFRFGLPAAVLGLVGGFATPLLVASEQANLPVLSFYLTLLTAGLVLTARRLGQAWLGALALVGGFVWGVVMLAGQPAAQGDLLAIGLYLLALGAAIPLLATEPGRIPVTRLASAVFAAVQMAALVALAGYDLLTWGLYLLLAGALVVLSWRERQLLMANTFVAAVALILLLAWPDPTGRDFAVVAVPLALLALANPLVRLWRDPADLLALAQVCVAAPALAAITLWHFGNIDNDVFQPGMAASCAALCAFPALALWKLWPLPEAKRMLAAPAAAAAVLAFLALHLLLPDWAEVAGAAVVTAALTYLAGAKPRGLLTGLAWIAAVVMLVTLLTTGRSFDEIGYLVDDSYTFANGERPLVQALLRWGVATLAFLALAWVERQYRAGRMAEALLAFTTYGLVAQVVPGDWLAWSAALPALACLWWRRQSDGFWGAMFVFGVLWALVPLGTWLTEGVQALAGVPMLASALPSPADVLLRLLPVTLVACLAAWQLRASRPGLALFGVAALVGGVAHDHVLFKQLFDLSGGADFIASGMAERTVWQALLIGLGVLLARLVKHPLGRQLGMISAALGLAHFTVFTLVLHNPLWDEQAVGPLPLANWLLPAYALAGAGVWWLFAQLPERQHLRLRPLRDGLVMLLVSLWALSALRHGFAGSLLVGTPLSQTEDLLRSLLGIVLALGFLWWGSRTQQRSWRIGSLVLMLLAVLKVFLIDAAGLEGLLRIASFLALGASLIGIGWVYSRQLRRIEEGE